MPFWWGRNSEHHEKIPKERNRPKPKSFDETILLTRNSSRPSRDFAISSKGSSEFSGFDPYPADDKREYPLPLPLALPLPLPLPLSTGSFTPSPRSDQGVSGFGVESGSGSTASSSGSSSIIHNDDLNLVHDNPHLVSFRILADTNINSWPSSSPISRDSTASPPLQSPMLGCTSLEPSARKLEMTHPSHPLPLPPDSPSKTSRCVKSEWKKGRLLGRGTFGHVYTGFNSENGQMCAIKEVRIVSNDQRSKECLKQLNQEIALLSQFSHPNIVHYYGSELGGDKLSVYLEYVSGGSIYKLLQEYGPFGEPIIQIYTRQILSGLTYLHGRNMVHRDIKGANILVDPTGEIKLADFGMAKHMTSCSSMLSFKGSPYWMAPEVIMNAGGYSFSLDIWSLGCTVLEMAASKPPWSNYEGVAAIFKIANSRDMPEVPAHLSDNAKNFVELCLQRNPSSRPTAAELLQHPFIKDSTRSKMS